VVPFGVNLTILPSITPPPYDEYRQVIVNDCIKIVETAGSNPAPLAPHRSDFIAGLGDLVARSTPLSPMREADAFASSATVRSPKRAELVAGALR
jgi:hypothetical protein